MDPIKHKPSRHLSILSILAVATFAGVVVLATMIATGGWRDRALEQRWYGLLASGNPAILGTFRTENLVVDQVASIGSASIQSYPGNPNGALTALKGALAMDTATPAIWQNQDGATTWQQVGAALNTGNIEGWGDSNLYGNGSTDNLLDQFLATPFPSVTVNQLLGAGTPFVVDYTIPDEALQPYAPSTGANMGVELSLGRAAYDAGRTTTRIGKFACRGATLDRFVPSGGDLWPLMIAYMDARVASWGPIGAFVVDEGTNDASDPTLAAQWGSNFSAVMTGLRLRYGNVPAFIRQTMPNLDAAYPYAALVRAQQAAFASNPYNYTVLVNTDDVPLSNDNIHFTADGYELIGYRDGVDIVKGLGPPQSAYLSGAPRFVGGGFGASAVGATSPVEYPIADVPSYFDILIISETGASEPTLASAAGFTKLAATSSTGGGITEWCAAYYRRAKDRDRGAPTTAATAESAARIWTFRQPTTIQGSPLDVAAVTGANNAAVPNFSLPGVTTVTNNSMVAQFQCAFAGSPRTISAWTNSVMANFTVQAENQNFGGGDNQILTLDTGTMPIKGASGATTATTSNYLVGAYITLAFKP